MSLEKIIEKIISDAEAEAERIIRQSRNRADELKKSAEREAEERASAYLREALREANLQAGRIVTQARLEKKLEILRQKRTILDDVMREAFRADLLRRKELKRKIIGKAGEREELLDKEKLIEELRQRLEKDIIEALKI
jgi:vacuolar-type H+-ATPase subunit E/Vma4